METAGYFLSKDKRALAIPLDDDPDKISEFKSTFPMARMARKNDTPMGVFSFDADVVRALRRQNYNVPAPVKYHYNFGRFTPFEAQLAALELFTLHRRCFCLNDMGTGKTLSALWALDYLKQLGEVKRALVIAPLSTLEDTWEKEALRELPHLSVGVLHGTAAKRKKVLNENHDVYVVNHDGVKVLSEELYQRQDIDLFVVDELSAFRNPKAERSTVLRALAKTRRRVWGMTATPTPNAPTDAYSQVAIVRPENLKGMRFGRFKDMTMVKFGQFDWRPRDDAPSLVREAMTPAVRYSLDDCMDIPETLYLQRRVQFTGKQVKAYKQMMKDLKLDGVNVTAANEGVKLQKLIQIGAGFAYDENGTPVFIGCDERLNLLESVLNEFTGQFLLFVPFTAAAKIVQSFLANKGVTSKTIVGSTSDTDRRGAFAALRDGTARGLVAHPRTMSHGLNLSEATSIIWFSPYPSLETFQQANRRIRRPGQKHITRVIALVGSNAEVKVYQRLKRNEKVQGTLLELIEEDKGKVI